MFYNIDGIRVRFAPESALTVPNHRFGLKAGARRILLPSYCHRRSLVGTGEERAILNSKSLADVIAQDVGCYDMTLTLVYGIGQDAVSRHVRK